MLGYGAMELRGAPRGRDVTHTQAEAILNAVLDAGINYIDTSVEYGVSEERIGRYIGHRRAEYYLASKCGCLVGAPPLRVARPALMRLPGLSRRAWSRASAGCEPIISTCSSSTSRRRGKPWRSTGPWRRCSNSRAPARSGTSACPAPCPISRITSPWTCSRSFRSLLGGRARARGAHRGGRHGGSRHRRSGRCGQGRANRGQARRRAMGTVAAGRPRRPARRHDAHGVHPALHLHPSGPAHEHRRHDQSRPSSAQCRCLAARTIASRCLRRSQAPPSGRGFNPARRLASTSTWGRRSSCSRRAR